MKIHSVKKEDRGTYYCVADNGIGKPAQRNVAVEVKFPPTVEVGEENIFFKQFDYLQSAEIIFWQLK